MRCSEQGLSEEESPREAKGSSRESRMRHKEEFGIQLQDTFFTVLRIKGLWSNLSHPNEAVLTRMQKFTEKLDDVMVTFNIFYVHTSFHAPA